MNKSKWYSNEVVSALYVCVHEGKYNQLKNKWTVEESNVESLNGKEISNKIVQTCLTIKGGCKEYTKEKSTMKWKVKNFEEKHSHKIVTTSKRMKTMPNKRMHQKT